MLKDKTITDQYYKLIDESRFTEALEVIEEIIALSHSNSTSHFNHGICLFKLGRYDESANAFLRAYELDETNWNALYKACTSLALENNVDELYEVFKTVLEWNPYMLNDFIEEKLFNTLFLDSKFKNLIEQYSEYIGKEE